jgi:hypothetical protein
MHVLPCFLCGHRLEKRTTKKLKPYFVCDRCGIQLFVRGKQGIERLAEFFRNSDKAEFFYKQHAQNFHKIQAILKEIDDVEQELKKLGISFFFDDGKLRIRNALRERKENLFFRLEQFAKQEENERPRKDEST